MGLIDSRAESIPVAAIVGRRKKGGSSTVTGTSSGTDPYMLISAVAIGINKLIGVDANGKAVLATINGVPAIGITTRSCGQDGDCYYTDEGIYNIYNEAEDTGIVELGVDGTVARAVDYSDGQIYQQIGNHIGGGNVLLKLGKAIPVSIPN